MGSTEKNLVVTAGATWRVPITRSGLFRLVAIRRKTSNPELITNDYLVTTTTTTLGSVLGGWLIVRFRKGGGGAGGGDTLDAWWWFGCSR